MAFHLRKSMKDNEMMDALVQVKRIGALLNEVLDTSRQLADSVDRGDQVSIQLLVAMREEPIRKLQAADQVLRYQIGTLPKEDARTLTGLLNGETEGSVQQEIMLATQAAANRRILKQVVELDEVLNRKLTHEQSVYNEK